MTVAERKATTGLAIIFGLRMFGLFLILPVFTLYADALAGATPTLIGLAIGAYGLTQALLQIPMGLASDRFGRRPIIVAGLVLFVIGSVVAALADSIYGVILGRALQGSGAISAAVMALAADLTRDTQRTKAMAIIGMSVGGAFMLALILGPVFAGWGGLAGVFWATAVLALAAIGLLYLLVPGEAPRAADAPISARAFAQVLRDPDLLRLDAGIFALHLVLTAGFVVLPVVLSEYLGLASSAHWKVYVPVLLLSVLAMIPIIAYGERRRIMHRVLRYVVLALVLAQLALAWSLSSSLAILAALWFYFAVFNTLEASLPSLISRFAPPHFKGAALGVYSTSQFLGAFCGGMAGGALYGRFGVSGVFLFCAIVSALWFFAVLGLRAPVLQDEAG